MRTYDIVFCVLTYKNHNDLEEFINSLRSCSKDYFSYKVVVVNNYADESSLDLLRSIAVINNCDFIENDNKGYGHGNNIGINFINDNYIYKHLVVCNPDTIIEKFNYKGLNNTQDIIIAPRITKLSGKKQNPMNYKFMKLGEAALYKGFKRDNKYIVFLGLLLVKVSNTLFEKIKSRINFPYKIHACHGSFIIFGNKTVSRLLPVFDENIFLYCEEGDLARKCKKNGIDIYYYDEIHIIHKEDGSMNLSNINLNEMQKKSYVYYYEKWNK